MLEANSAMQNEEKNISTGDVDELFWYNINLDYNLIWSPELSRQTALNLTCQCNDENNNNNSKQKKKTKKKTKKTPMCTSMLWVRLIEIKMP